ncbi:phosphotransferase [Colletotrichum asianum]|uniref:Phosphotransferase n=1 Tax=Colletotrichum asianum TaxID=702518 RepID=A0A8H3WPQ7_9PEZI|nr:phosphotransferase [Colletotrichum asianum]
METRQDPDNLAWDRSDALWEEATKKARRSSQCRKIESLVTEVLAKPATFVTPLVFGGFNILYPFHIEGTPTKILLRMPCPGQTIFPEEKTLAEIATAGFVASHTDITVPTILHHGTATGIGPYMIIEDLGTRKTLSQAMQAPCQTSEDTFVLNLDLSNSKLKRLYIPMARYVLQLAQPTFPRIGALAETRPGRFCVAGRPITLTMRNMVHLSNIPEAIFPPKGTTYGTSDEWLTVLAEMQLATLIFQHNDIVSSADDCRNKYVARQLFRRLAKEGRLSKFGFVEDDWSAISKETRARLTMPDATGSFRLWCDDFRPGNVLINDKHDILGAIDWEFAYIGPTQFLLDSPWWLLLDSPETWESGTDDWAVIYESRLMVWLSAMEEVEKDMEPGAFLLSAYMRDSWETGRFWLDYAVRKNLAFDAIYWKFLDRMFFGACCQDVPAQQMWKTRVHLLSAQEQSAMELLVHIKMEESKERVLVQWDGSEAREHFQSFLFD